ncbi:hypothetical protein KBZ15_07760 [Cyanobium sp. BA20m-p-22]|uniref:hypothetical protein n=1 Tax=Cyanobium sp. BA20m-p-22 TaxID=2823704 RepID=UPI0020CC8174|nr:hypothetical protein [Cyanobium sp. BA20m-p-22]MCP9909801.1 hypothetical protein [Cyanobium sp. BA20m-p-22]
MGRSTSPSSFATIKVSGDIDRIGLGNRNFPCLFSEFHTPFLAQSPATDTRGSLEPHSLAGCKALYIMSLSDGIGVMLFFSSNQDMRVPVSLRLAAPIAVMDSIALLPIKAHANAFVFANPAGFGSQGASAESYNFLGTGDLSVTAPFIGGGIISWKILLISAKLALIILLGLVARFSRCSG